MYPDYRLGNLTTASPKALATSPRQRAFGEAKASTLPQFCQQCEFLFACRGECPKNRFTRTPDGEPGLNYLCPSYKHYFRHLTPYLNGMAELICQGQPASRIMEAGRRR